MYQVAHRKVEDSSFRVNIDVSDVPKVPERPWALSTVLRLNHDSATALVGLKKRQAVITSRLETTFDRKALRLELYGISSEITRLEVKVCITNKCFYQSFVEQGGVVPVRRPFDSFDLRKFCLINNFAQKNGYEEACLTNSVRVLAELRRRRQHCLHYRCDCVCQQCNRPSAAVQAKFGTATKYCPCLGLTRLYLNDGAGFLD